MTAIIFAIWVWFMLAAIVGCFIGTAIKRAK